MHIFLILLALLSPAWAWDEKGPITIFGIISHLSGSTFEIAHINRAPIKVIVTAPMPSDLIDGNKVVVEGTFNADRSTFTAITIKKD